MGLHLHDPHTPFCGKGGWHALFQIQTGNQSGGRGGPRALIGWQAAMLRIGAVGSAPRALANGEAGGGPR
jgi:hypothetical protein